MQHLFTRALPVFFLFNVIFNFLSAESFEKQKKTQMIQDLEVIKHHFEAGYAPAIWKKEYSGWDLEEAFKYAKTRILNTKSITTKQFQIIVRDFINTMKDYHVDVMFFSTESAALPFSVKGAQGRYFINWIDSLRLPPSHYSIRVGDELLEFDGRPIAEVVEELKQSGKGATPATDQALAEMKLTLRSGMAGDVVPKGSIIIKSRSATTGKSASCQLCWSYTPEHVKNPKDFLPFLDFISFSSPLATEEKTNQFPKIMMANPLHQAYAEKYADHNGGLGSRKSFVPMLGELIWIKENEDDSDEDFIGLRINWYAYIYRHPQGQSIGYLRIPHYMGFSTSSQEFGEILAFLEENTDALVIDQLHNFGGFVHFQYELASMLAVEPLKTPYHRVKITQKEVLEAYRTLEFIKLIDLFLQSEECCDKTDKEKDEEDIKEEDRFNYQEMMFFKNYYEFILEEWNKGHTLTSPTPILGMDRINPHPKYQYTKPILVLINEMDFSGGDFMPAILQDNKRALLFGSRTAGAGGYVFAFEFPNSHGIALCAYTASIAERTNLQKIENLGVTPDIEYQLTPEDLQNGYQGYIQSVNQAVQYLLENKQN